MKKGGKKFLMKAEGFGFWQFVLLLNLQCAYMQSWDNGVGKSRVSAIMLKINKELLATTAERVKIIVLPTVCLCAAEKLMISPVCTGRI